MTLFLLALGLAVIMGFTTQRGSTCAYLAVREWVADHAPDRLLSLFETACWILAVTTVLSWWDWQVHWPADHPFALGTVMGGIVIGVGAYVNRACVIGTLAQIGNGHWHFCWTVVGYFVASWLWVMVNPYPLTSGSPAIVASHSPSPGFMWAYAPLSPLAMIYLLRWTWRHRLTRIVKPGSWPIHRATVIVGLTFSVVVVTYGPWSYTDWLSDLARGASGLRDPRLLLTLALGLGLLIGGATAKRLQWPYFNGRLSVRCAMGGALMGLGGAWVPGGNDSLLLVGLPCIRPSALIAILLMLMTLYICTRWEAPSSRTA